MTIAALVAAGPLRMGASGAAVKEIQFALKARGYPLNGTGISGRRPIRRSRICGARAAWCRPSLSTLQRRQSSMPDWILGLGDAALVVGLPGAFRFEGRRGQRRQSRAGGRYQVGGARLSARRDAVVRGLGIVLPGEGRRETDIATALGAVPAVGAIAVQTRNGGGHRRSAPGRVSFSAKRRSSSRPRQVRRWQRSPCRRSVTATLRAPAQRNHPTLKGNEMPDRGVIIAAVGLVIVVLSSVGGLVGRLSHRARVAR
jgi:hypothetical protein